MLLFIGGILLMGVTKGIEGIAKKLMPILFLLLLLLRAVSLSLSRRPVRRWCSSLSPPCSRRYRAASC
ncbi:hypothetical protein [Duganella aceris]|uniref:hypothetical protein n=1 Tax=Duganella aceris TaxID=2703883 RepID=UPI001E3C9FA1|nr:hypothetical protein [Duganella aceris]